MGLIVVAAAAAIAFFVFSPLEPDESVVAEQTAPQAAADTSEASMMADTAAGEEPAASTAEEPEDPVAEEWDPLRSTDGIDPSREGYTIVVYSETSRNRAEDAAERYRDEGYRTGVLEHQDDGAARFRVGVGQFATLPEAADARDRLAGNDLPDDAWVYRVQ